MDQNKIKEEYKLFRDQLEMFKLFTYNSKIVTENNPHYTNLITKMYELENMIHLSFNFESNFEELEQEHNKPSIYYEKTICSYCKHDIIYHSDKPNTQCSYSKDTIKCNCFISHNNVLEVHHITVKVDEQGNEIEK